MKKKLLMGLCSLLTLLLVSHLSVGGIGIGFPVSIEEDIHKSEMKKDTDNIWSMPFISPVRSCFGSPVSILIQKMGILFCNIERSEEKSEEDLSVPKVDNSFTPGDIVFDLIPNGTVEGVNVIDPTTVTFVLHDQDRRGKRKGYAYVIGDFNDWKVDNKYQMKRDEHNGCWWCTVTGLESGKEYAFQYYVGSTEEGFVRLADAYTEKTIDPLDTYIPASTYPGLRPYPSDKTSEIISTFKTEMKEDVERTFFKVKDKHNLVIYEMLFRDFTPSGDINGAIEKLDYLKNLGVTAIEAMPVQEFDGNDSWGYNPAFFFALDKAYGTKEMYHRFIEECHKRDIAVIFDVVYNHATENNPFARLYWDNIENKTASNNPWFNVDAPHPYSVFHDFNHESPLVRKFVKRNLQFLLKEYGIDGFRFDLSKGLTQKRSTEATASNYDPSRVYILREYNRAIKEIHPEAIVILEHFADESEERELAREGMMLWRNVNNAYCQSAMGWGEFSGFTPLGTIDTTMPFGAWVGYMESHDEERTAYKQTQWGNYTLKTDLPTRMKQLAVNSALCFTVPGPKMIWQFGELGYDISIEENGRTGRKPVKWEYFDNRDRKELYNVYSTLINFRNENPELFDASTAMKWQVNTTDWDYGRYVSLKATNGKGMVAVGNFTDKPVECFVNFQSTGTWYNYMNKGETLTVSTSSRSVTVPAHEFILYTNFR